MTNRVTVNQAALAAHLHGADGQKVLTLGTNRLKATAQQNSPNRTGYFRRRFRVKKYPTFHRLYNVDHFGHLVEFGSVNNPAYAPIRKAARALGYKFRGSSGQR